MSRFASKSLATLLLVVAIAGSGLARSETVLITGSSAGIGLEFAKQYAAAGWTVYATHPHDTPPKVLTDLRERFPEVRIDKMDVTSEEDVRGLAARLSGVAIDVLINNAGLYNQNGDWSTQNFGRLDFAFFDRVMAVNVKGPLLVTESFVSHVVAGKSKKVIAISSTVGILSEQVAGSGGIFYKASKAALNREMLALSDVLKSRGITVLMVHPGAVRTEAQSAGNVPGMIDTKDTVSAMIRLIAGATMADTGRFLQYDGKPLPW
jgi:NAD(P)-dependent dehydrogenase (short-subunit alcohol dehydrogenase family)